MITKITSRMKKLKPIIVFFCVSAVSGVVIDYVRLNVEFYHYKKLHQDSVALVQQIKEIKHSISNVDLVLATIQGFSSKLKKMVSLPQELRGSRYAKQALQPPETDALDLAEEGELIEKMNLDEVKSRVDDLHSEVIKQKNIMEEISQFFDQNPSLLTAIPSVRPAQGYVTSKFGFRLTPRGKWQLHEGVDFGAYYGTNVVAAADGLVEIAGYSPSYGRYVVINHGYGLKTKYAHTSVLLVKAGQAVERGEKIAQVGRTGHSRGTHLHYEVKLNGVPLDPKDFMFN